MSRGQILVDLEAFVAAAVAVGLGVSGYLVKYVNDLKLAQRKDNLDRVNAQLQQLYGPLFALDAAGRMAWIAFRSQYRPGQQEGYWKGFPMPSDEEAAAWRLWMKEVFMPLNLRMVETIAQNSHLLEEEMDASLQQLFGHVYAYIPVLKAWETGNYSRNTSLVAFPQEELHAYVRRSYDILKKRQTILLGRQVGV